jgi:hypothetical protein
MNDTIYQSWHRKIGHAEYRLHITMAGYGNDEDAAEAFLEGFLSAHPEAGAVISQNSTADTITATFSLAATGEEHALQLGIAFWAESGEASGLDPHEVVRTEIELVCAEAEEVDQELPKVPA